MDISFNEGAVCSQACVQGNRGAEEGCQFTSLEFTRLLKAHGIQIKMDGSGRWLDNVFVERLWRSLKYEEVYLHAYETIHDAHQRMAHYVTFYNQIRPHRALDGRMFNVN